MIRNIELITAWVVSYIISLGILIVLAVYNFLLDMFELPFDVWETVKEKYDEYE